MNQTRIMEILRDAKKARRARRQQIQVNRKTPLETFSAVTNRHLWQL